MAKIGNVEFNVISEKRSFPNEVTQHAVEDGADVTDHVRNLQRSFDIDGFVGDNEDPPRVHDQLVQMKEKRKPVDYSGRAVLTHCIIEDFNSNVDVKSRRGFSFSMKITQIKVAKPSTVSLLPVNLKVDVGEVGNAGRVQVQ